MKAPVGSALAAFALCALLQSTASADVTVVEYYHSGFQHYFITPVADEIAKLDAHAPPFELWSRTGRTFRAYESSAARQGATDICRFFNTSFAPKSSHFYAPRGLGCEDTIARFPDWGLEDDRLFAAMLPDANGTCPAGTIPVYRLYNNGQGGAPNHRFVTSLADRQAMLDAGYVAEGAGVGVGMCVPSTTTRATAEGLWHGVSSDGVALRIVVLPDNRYYAIYSPPGGDEQGLFAGTFQYGGANDLSSIDVLVVPLANTIDGISTSIAGTFSPASALQLNLGKSSVSANYDTDYDISSTVSALAGTYSGVQGHTNEIFPTTMTIDQSGTITVNGVLCGYAGKLTPRPSSSLFDASLDGSRNCKGLQGLHAIAWYDRTDKRLAVVTDVYVNPNSHDSDVFAAFGTKQ